VRELRPGAPRTGVVALVRQGGIHVLVEYGSSPELQPSRVPLSRGADAASAAGRRLVCVIDLQLVVAAAVPGAAARLRAGARAGSPRHADHAGVDRPTCNSRPVMTAKNPLSHKRSLTRHTDRLLHDHSSSPGTVGCETAPLRHDRGSAGRLVRCLRRWSDSRRGDLSHRADLCDVARRVGGGVWPGQY